jgi:selenocysteine-specific translation elongation factor
MNNLTIGIFGDKDFAKTLGKKGTSNDMELFNHGSANSMFTYVTINSDKIQPLLQILNMIDIPILIINEITKEIGELIIAIDQMNFNKGFILHNKSITKEQFEPIIKDTSLEKFDIMLKDSTEIRIKLEQVNLKIKDTENLIVPIDNYFQVKSVGTVILGIVKEGIIKKYDKLVLEPLGKEILVKSIQSKDKDVNEANERTRVGLCIKGIELKDLKRGQIITKKDYLKKTKNLKIKIKLSKYYKEKINIGKHIFLNVGLNTTIAKITEINNNIITIETEWEIAYNKEIPYLTKVIIAKTEQTLPRIIGNGIIIE